jgi:uncharacterized short protein YbdD (DUF466 family)
MADAVAHNGGWSKLANAIEIVRRIIGVPDYDTYVAHMKAKHPECAPMTKDEFAQQRMQDRYSRPGSRCC